MKDTVPIFIVSSGRSGTQMMHKILGEFFEVETQHEYLLHYVKPLAVKFRAGLIGIDVVKNELIKLYGSAILYTEKKIWVDTSYALSWIIKPLYGVFPNARFVHLVRDGRKVVSSFYHKLTDEIYDNRRTAIIERWLKNPGSIPEPPPEKRYWWYVPVNEPQIYREFQGYSQFERICFHWKDVNEWALKGLASVPEQQKYFTRLENIIQSKNFLRALIEFIGLEYHDSLFMLLDRPHNVNRPEDYPLTREELASFKRIAWDIMERFGYDREEEYRMKY